MTNQNTFEPNQDDDSENSNFEHANLELESRQMQCPYCWETFEWVCDDSDDSTEMIEDCPVCCRPIHFKRSGSFEFGEQSHWEALSEEDFYE